MVEVTSVVCCNCSGEIVGYVEPCLPCESVSVETPEHLTDPWDRCGMVLASQFWWLVCRWRPMRPGSRAGLGTLVLGAGAGEVWVWGILQLRFRVEHDCRIFSSGFKQCSLGKTCFRSTAPEYSDCLRNSEFGLGLWLRKKACGV